MSLINEALKKAQRQRSLDTAPLSSAPSGVAAAAVTTHVRAASHKRSLAPLWFGLGVLALGAGATVLVMRYGFDSGKTETGKPVALAPVAPPPSTASTPAPVATPAALSAPMVVLPPIPTATPAAAAAANAPASPSAPATPSAQPAPSIANSTPAPAVAAPAGTAPVTPVTTPVAASPATVVVTVPPAPVPKPATTPTAAATTPVAAVPTPAEREAKIYAFINSLRLTGVRGLDREARVLMNERVWRLNDIVAPDLGLRISAVRPNLLVFTDAQGKTYEKPY